MRLSIKNIRDNALSLPCIERTILIRDLLLSLEEEYDFDLEQKYEAGIKRRLESIKDGSVDAYSANTVFQKIKKNCL
jgi:putative addiction module component (TIGR02574 family)